MELQDIFQFDFNSISIETLSATILNFLPAILAFFFTLLLIRLFKFFILKQLKQISTKTSTDLDDLITDILDGFGKIFYIIIALYAASLFVSLPLLANTAIYYILLITVTFYSISAVRKFAKYLIAKSMHGGEAITSFFDYAITLILWSVALLLVLSNMGININTLIAGLSIGGLAIAFALQKVLEDVFSAFSLHYDRPFEKGDFIIIGNDMGVIKDIGIQTTRISTLEGQELIISNKEMTSSRINNYKKMEKRRISFTFGVTYQTPSKKLEQIPNYVKKIVETQKKTEFDRAHFASYGDSALIFEVVYYINISDYNLYMDIQQNINLELKKKMEKEKIDFAYPTQTIYYSKMS